MVTTRSQVKPVYVKRASVDNLSPQNDDVEVTASTKPLKRKALSQTELGGKVPAKKVTKKVKQAIKSNPIVIDDLDAITAPAETSAANHPVRNEPGKAQGEPATKKGKGKAEPTRVVTDKSEGIRATFKLPAKNQSQSSLLKLPLEIRSLIYKHAANSCRSTTEIKARNTLDFRIFPLPVVHYKKGPECPAGEQRNQHTLQNLMRTSQLMYAEAKAALYRNVPIIVSLGTAGPKQAFNIGRRPVNFPGTDFLEELAGCRTVKLANGFKSNYVANKPQQVKEEITAFLQWWGKHADTRHNARLVVSLTAYGIPSADMYGYGETLSLTRFEEWLPSLSPAARKTVSFRLSMSMSWGGTYYLSDFVKSFWEKNQDLVKSHVTYAVATAPAPEPPIASTAVRWDSVAMIPFSATLYQSDSD